MTGLFYFLFFSNKINQIRPVPAFLFWGPKGILLEKHSAKMPFLPPSYRCEVSSIKASTSALNWAIEGS